jgi:hypothetical protein
MEEKMGWEFYVRCHVDDTAIWTCWRWRYTQAGQVIEPAADFTTLRACKADAALHGFDPASSPYEIPGNDRGVAVAETISAVCRGSAALEESHAPQPDK